MSKFAYLKFLLSQFKQNSTNEELQNSIQTLTNSSDRAADKTTYSINLDYHRELIAAGKQAERLSQFKDIHKEEDCFIIGNGPSLNKIDLEKLNDFHCFGMNKIFLIFDRVPLKLSYYVAINTLVLKQSMSEIVKLGIPSFLSTTLMEGDIPDHENLFPIDTSGTNKRFETNIIRPIPGGATVTFAALQIAYYMGFKRVFLVGVDHNFNQKGKPGDKQVHTNDDTNHFDPRYFKGHEWQLADLEQSEISFQCAKLKFEREGRSIIDATHGGKLQVFEKMDYEDALQLALKKRNV